MAPRAAWPGATGHWAHAEPGSVRALQGNRIVPEFHRRDLELGRAGNGQPAEDVADVAD